MRKAAAAMLAIMLMIFGTAAAEGPAAPDFIMEGYDGDETGVEWDTNLFFTRMQEQTGVSFQFIQAGSYQEWTERKAEIAAGKDLPDVLFKAELTPAETMAMAESGILIDLKPYLEENAPHLWALLQENPEWLAAITLPDGRICALPAFNRLQNNDYMWINRQWLDRLHLSAPRTADELTEVLRAFRTGDPNRNGSADEIPLTFMSMWELRFLGHAYGIIDNDYYVSVEDGRVVSHLTTDENRVFLGWLHTLWTEGLLDSNGFTTVDTLRQVTDEKKAIPYGMMMAATPLSLVPAAALDQYEILPPLQAGGKQVYRDLTGDVIRGTFAITRACKDPARLIRWADILYTEEGSRMAQYGLEGEEYTTTAEGRWEWNDDLATVADVVLPQRTIGAGSAAPGIALESVQLTYAEDATRRNIEMMAAVRPFSLMPFPYVYLDGEDAAEIARIQADLMKYAEETMACFVTGDLALNDENWDTFCRTVSEKGLDRAVEIWQKYITKGQE